MKPISALLTLLFLNIMGFSQQVQYQTYTSVMELTASKNGEQFNWENKEITVRLDYETGSFITRLTNTDFINTGMETKQEPDSDQMETEYLLKGIFPINDIINQKAINQQYQVELQLVNDELSIREPVLFTMTITRPSSGTASYRVFILAGKLYNDQLGLPAFKDFDNEIEIRLQFNGYMNTR